ncbi:hypothetical protein pf16_56 [Pseudomonas phage pf16]|uniref:Uncharacterized protein n=1 Tax=Pseudomonas phage pf16 TaxID=1815630 RepID=A0A1S5R3K5_9CAUD|nr:hypothetical protein FDG98_gp055 [Pseudomonas phage pf16]AND74979.1 hypothetical protein pf16_56 [Pseudomonas phage pf16]
MSDFKPFGQAVQHLFNQFINADKNKNQMFIVDVAGDDLWAHYLASFPAGTNPIFRERTEHDCSCCRNFVKNIGNVVYVKNGELMTVWDINIDDPVYSVVAKEMAKLVRSAPIKSIFLVGESSYGSAPNRDDKADVIWNHFHVAVPRERIIRNNASNAIGERSTDVAVLKRSVTEITADSIEVVSDLIASNSLYRGAEHKGTVAGLKKCQAEYAKLKTERERELWLWNTATPATRYRGTVIGTLLVALSEGEDLESAVKSFESKVAPQNYKRSTALVTQKMIDAASKKVEELGLEASLQRRYAVKEDISVNDVLFVNRDVKPKLLGGAFDSIAPTKQNAPELKNVETISVADFLANVLPRATEVELFVKSQHANNFVSLVAPAIADAQPLFKWGNAFSWSYDGEVTDSIKERVKAAGGKVDGALRVSLSWFNGDDLDLAVIKNGGERVYFGDRNRFGAALDVDMNAGCATNSTNPVENIVWSKHPQNGTYTVEVNNFNQRSTSNAGFEIEVEFGGRVFSFAQPKGLRHKERVSVGTITVRGNEITVHGLKEGSASIEKWGVTTEQWVPVDMVMRSPNFWEGKQVGNEHLFFMLKGCVNPDSTRGFYNEFLRDDLNEHRKVFELLGSKLKAPASENQLSGIGISTTKKESITVRVKGSVNRVLNVSF